MADALYPVLSAIPWPLPVRPSVDVLTDPETRRLIATALLELGLAFLLLSISAWFGRGRIVAAAVALPLMVLRVPSLGLLLVPATPASFRPSPTGFSAASIAAGRTVFAANCVVCHGNAADGAGGLGAQADLRLGHIWSHPEGDLFWFVTHGKNAPDGTALMPAFEAVLPERARWSAIDYVHALSAGAATRGLDGWPRRLIAPEVALSCSSSAVRSIAGLRGQVVRVVLGSPPAPLATVPPVNGVAVVTVWIPGSDTEPARVPGVDCVSRGDGDVVAAYAILAGSPDGRIVAARFLIDPDGVLRSVWRKDDGDGWTDPERLLEEVRTICTEPLTIEAGDEHEHHH